GRLSVVQPPAGAVTLSYDALGRRVKKQAPTQTRKYLYDFKHLLQETDGGSVLQREHTFTPGAEYGDLVSQYDSPSAGTLYHEYDALGSTQGLLNDAAAEADRWVYRAYGLQTQTTGTDANNLTFVGRQGYVHDSEAELYLLDARYYDPAAGRFV